MAQYTDTSRLVFERALENLEGRLPQQILTDLQVLLNRTEFHDAEAVRRLLEQGEAASDAD